MAHRASELKEIRRLLAGGSSIQMLAPRRVGKTYLMREVEQELRAEGWITIFCDLEGMRTQEEFLRDLCRKIEEVGTPAQRAWHHLTHRVQQLTGGGFEGNPINAIGKVDPKRFCEALVESLNEQSINVVILVDEIALFVSSQLVEDPKATHDFLYHLRRLQQNYPVVRWLLTGSIGLDVVARRANLSGALVDFEIFLLEPFSETEARAYVDQLCESGKTRWPFLLDDASFRYLAEQLGWLSPYYLKLIADRIRTDSGEVPPIKVATVADVESAFEQMLAPAHRTNFSTWEEHLRKNFPKADSDRLHAVLEACCSRPDGEMFPTVLARVASSFPGMTPRELKDALTTLANDGFLSEVGDRWRFRSGLLRRYWIKYVCP